MNPYVIQGPALISFSGGRTSAYMLRQILDAHGGTLPPDVVVAFANTGREREETLRFVYECGVRWNVDVIWLEWQDSKPGFRYVGLQTASRNGEPFAELIRKKKRLPNWQERWCTTHLKIRPMQALMRHVFDLEPGQYLECVGLRDDEASRIGDMVEGDAKTGRKRTAPLARAKVTKREVMAFWAAQDFDLGIDPWEGNCDLCFATGRNVRLARLARNPSCGAWWAEQERLIDGVFDRRDSVEGLMRAAVQTPDIFESMPENDAECGLHCGATE